MVAVGLTAAEVVEILVEEAIVEDGTLEVIADDEILDDETLVEEAADEVALVEEGLTVDEMIEELDEAQAEGLNFARKVFSRIVFIQ
jgi:hypothetical protein